MINYPRLERGNHAAVGILHIPGRAIILQTSGVSFGSPCDELLLQGSLAVTGLAESF